MSDLRIRPIRSIPVSNRRRVTFDVPITEVVQGYNLRFEVQISGSAMYSLLSDWYRQLVQNINFNASSSLRTTVGRLKTGSGISFINESTLLRGVSPYLWSDVDFNDYYTFPRQVIFDIPIDFESLHTQNRRMSLLNTRELSSAQFTIDMNDINELSANPAMPSTGMDMDGVIEVYAREFIDDQAKALQYSLSRRDLIEQAVSSSNQNMQIDLRRGFVTRGILVHAFNRESMAIIPNDQIIRSITLNVNREIKHSMTWDALKNINKNDYGITCPAGTAYLDLIADGQLDGLVNTALFQDVSLTLDVNGGATNVIQLYPSELIMPGL